MLAQFILYIIPTIFLQTQSFYMENEAKWPTAKLDYGYDSIEEALKNNAPAKNETQIIKDKLSSLISRTKEDISEKMSAIERVHRNFENNSLYKVRAAENFVTQMLRVLHNLMSKKQKESAHDTRNTQNQYESGIAWSYYDDAGH